MGKKKIMINTDKEIENIQRMIHLLNRCVKLHLSNDNHKQAKLCLVDIFYLEKKLDQTKKRNQMRIPKKEAANGKE